jgi:hypothetical protein
VGLESVHAHNLGAAADLEAQKLLASLQDSVGTLVERAQVREPLISFARTQTQPPEVVGGQRLPPRKTAVVGRGCTARSSSTTFSTGVSGTAGSWPGSVSGMPKTNSAEERPLSSLGAALRLNNTQGRCSGHLGPASRAVARP